VGRIRVDATTFTEAAPVATPHIGYRGLLFPLERYRLTVAPTASGVSTVVTVASSGWTDHAGREADTGASLVVKYDSAVPTVRAVPNPNPNTYPVFTDLRLVVTIYREVLRLG